MRKGSFFILLSIIASVLFVSPLFSPAYANTHSSSFFVSGHVNDTNGKNLKNADVEITCNGETKQTKTDSYGHYIVPFSRSDCRNNNSITVFASGNNQNGYGQAKAANVGNSNVDVSCNSNPVSVPEFGFWEAMFAAIFCLSLFFFFGKSQKTS